MSKAFPVHRQLDSADCGPACLRMVASYYGRELRHDQVRSLMPLSRDGVSIHAMGRAAERLGFRTLPASLPFESLRDEVPLPAIVHWKGTHFLVVYEVDDHGVKAVDPAFGRVELERSHFVRSWTGTDDGSADGIGLLLEPTPSLIEDEGSNDSAARPPTRGLAGYFALFGQVADHLVRFKGFGLQIGASILAASVIQLLFPLLTQALVDQGIVGRDLGLIWLILVAQLALFAGRTIGEVIRARLLLHVGARVAMALRADFVRKLVRLPVAFFDTRLTGDIDRRLNDQFEVQRLLTQSLTPAITAMVNIVVFGAVLAWYSLLILVLFLAGTALYVGWTFTFLERARQVVYRRLRLEAAMHNLLQQIVHGIEDLKVFCAQQITSWKWERKQAELFQVALDETTVDQLQVLGGGLINELKNIVITLVAATLVVSGELTLGMMLAIQYIVGALNGPIGELQAMIRGTDRSRVALERLEEFRRVEAEDEGPFDAGLEGGPTGSIRLEAVSFAYGSDHQDPVLSDVDLTIPEGKVTAIVGVSGSGKTTLVRLLLGFYSPTAGSITVGGHDLTRTDPNLWRSRCGVVLQGGYLFADTLARNIALGDDEPDPERLERAARLARVLPLVRSHAAGFQRVVGLDGQGLSGGEKQRILIARALYAEPRYLFFDEATNALDAETERLIVEGLSNFHRGRTVVTVAHRLSTVQNADQIAVLDKGRMVEMGTHEELTDLRGHYYKLVKNQLELGA